MGGNAVYKKRGEGIELGRYDRETSYSSGSYVSPIRSADTLKTRELSAAAKLSEKYKTAGVALEPGDIVEHDRFGRGTVIESQENIVTVIFDSVGTKKMGKDKAPMKKVR